MAGRLSTDRIDPTPRLIGVGDSSFQQIPCLTAATFRFGHDGSYISKISCGATVAVALVSCSTSTDGAPLDGNATRSRLLEWGTGMYGERLATVEAVSDRDEESLIVGTRKATTTTTTTTAKDKAGSTNTRQDFEQHKRVQLLNVPTEVLLPLSLFSPLKVRDAILSIACGAHFVVAAIAGGGAISWGGAGGREQRHRELGLGDCGLCQSCSTTYAEPAVSHDPPPPTNFACKPGWVQDPLGRRGQEIISLAAGDGHTIAVCRDGSAWSWGRGDCGQLGAGACLHDRRGPGSCRPLKVQLPQSPTRDGVVRSRADSVNGDSGRNGGSIGVGADGGGGGVRIREAACGRDHSALLTERGRIFTFGSGLYGQLGVGTVGERAWTPTQVDSLDGVGTMRKDGTFTGISSVACGAWHTAAISTTGDVYTWGWARFGALGSLPREEPFDTNSAAISSKTTIDGKGTRAPSSVPSVGGGGGGAEEGAEVRPYPGLVDGVDSLSGEDDQIVTVGCGARYTVALSRSKRAFVWGQVSPCSGGGEGRQTIGLTSGCDTSATRNMSQVSTSSVSCHPRELDPTEILRLQTTGGVLLGEGCTDSGCSGGGAGGAGGVDGGTTRSSSKSSSSRCSSASSDGDMFWTVSTVGCGPWYIVLGLEKGSPVRTGSYVGEGDAPSLGSSRP